MAAETFYYARVSSSSQNPARQLDAFKKNGNPDDHHIYIDKYSGKTMDRPKYQAMKNTLRSGDTLVVMSLDRLGRNKQQIKDELEYYRKNDIRVRILDLPTSNIDPKPGQEWITDMVNNIIIEILASQAEQERLTIRERQAQGIAIAKAEGKYQGRQRKQIDEDLFGKLFQQYCADKISKAEMARQLGVSRPTMNKILQRKGLLK